MEGEACSAIHICERRNVFIVVYMFRIFSAAPKRVLLFAGHGISAPGGGEGGGHGVSGRKGAGVGRNGGGQELES